MHVLFSSRIRPVLEKVEKTSFGVEALGREAVSSQASMTEAKRRRRRRPAHFRSPSSMECLLSAAAAAASSSSFPLRSRFEMTSFKVKGGKGQRKFSSFPRRVVIALHCGRYTLLFTHFSVQIWDFSFGDDREVGF